MERFGDGRSMNISSLRVTFIGKRGDGHSEEALEFCRRHCGSVRAYMAAWGEPYPAMESSDLLLSYMSRWIVKPTDLRKFGIAISFHPATPDYPGFGCASFAIHQGATEFGVTCHHMDERIDSGPIILVKRFPIFPNDNVASLLRRTYDYQLATFYDVLARLNSPEPLPRAQDERWRTTRYTRTDFERLRRIGADASVEEIAKIVRATAYDSYAPTIVLHGYSFRLVDGDTDDA
jgi:hypothetical protein